MMSRTITFAKQHTPDSLRVVARRALLEAHNARLRFTVPVTSRCGYQNIYHCTMRKAASQWIQALFTDPLVYRYSGLLPYVPRYYKWRHPQAIPPGRAALSLYLSYKRFETLPKPESHRAFFVLRDPRDIVVSSYFSSRNSHTPMGDVLEVRKVLQEKPMKEGLLYVIDHLAKKRTFSGLRSWAIAADSGTTRLFRYEDLTGERQLDEVNELMRHCGIVIPPAELEGLLSRYSFSRMRSDRESAAPTSHYRKGKPGDWQNYFDDDVYAAFAAATGNLVDLLGYPARDMPRPS
jgi:hypothetical protein